MMRKAFFLWAFLAFPMVVSSSEFCNPAIRDKYCSESYGGDFHTGCKYCGIGPACPTGVSPSGRGINNIDLIKEILDRHNIYRNQVKQRHLPPSWPSPKCLQMLRWDNDLAEVAQIWADQCANVIYGHRQDMYPKIFHERGMDRTTKNFNGPPGVGQNVAWALTKDVNFSKIIDDLWYKDINNFQPGYINEFNVDDSDGSLMTQIIWGRTTHVGCGWVQFPMGSHVDGLYPEGEYENFFVCNYGVGGNVPGEPVYECLSDEEGVSPTLPSSFGLEIQFGERYPTASPEIQSEIQACFEAIACENKSPAKGCNFQAINCMREMEKELLIFVSPKDRVRVFECRIEFVLCSVELEPGFEMCNEFYEFCKVNRLTSPSDILVSSKDVDLTTIRPQTTVANRALTPSSSRLTLPKIDISFYNASARTSYKLAICLEGSRCDGEHNETCFSLQSECNQGLDLTPVPNPVRKKLSECSIDDILCHLDGSSQTYSCQQKFETCADIVIPNDITISALPLFGEAGSHLEPFLFLLGLTDVGKEVENLPPTENVLTNVTNNVLGALDSAFGGIEILPINTSINTLLNDNETLPIFQDIVVIIKTNETDNTTEYSVSGQGPIDVMDKYPDLDNATVIFSTSNIRIGGSEGHSTIRDPLVDSIKDKIRESLSEIATECNQHICFEGIDESRDKLQNPFLGLENVMAFTSPGELQLKIAVCLQGIRCVRDKTCLKAQKKCIGKDNVVKYMKDDRIKISECVLEAHVCRMENGSGDERCDLTFTHCLNPIFDILNSKQYQIEFLNPDYANFTSLSDVLKSFPLDIMPKDGDQFFYFSDEMEKDPEELIRDVTSNITEMIIHSDRKQPVQLIPISLPGWNPDLRVSNDSGVISILNSNPHFSFKTPNGTTSFLIESKDNSFEMIEKTISSILENPIDENRMKDVVRNISQLFRNSNAEVMELRPINDFLPNQSHDVVQGDVIILKKNDGQIALISSSPQLSFNSSNPIMSLSAEDLVPEEIQAIVENSIISNRIKSPSKKKKKPDKTDMIDRLVSQIMNLIGNENSGTIQLRPINSNGILDSLSQVSVLKEDTNGDRVFQIISQSPEIMTFITPENSTISVDLEALPPNQIPHEIHNMLNFIAEEALDPKEEVKSSSPLRDIAQKISSGIRPEDNLVRIKPINGIKKGSHLNDIILNQNPQEKIIEVISHDEKTHFSTPENLIVEIDVKDLDNQSKMTSRIEDTLLSLVDSSKFINKDEGKENEVGSTFYSHSDMEINEIIRQLAMDISILSRDTTDVIVVKPQNSDSTDGRSDTNVERDLESKILKLKLTNPRVRFITPENSTLAIDISNLNREDVTRRVEDTLRSILKETKSKESSMNTLLDNGFTNEIIQNLTSNALLELNGQIGGDFEILPISDSHDLYDLLKDNDTLKFKVDFTVEPNNEGGSISSGRNKEEPLVIISNTPVQKVGSDFQFNEDSISESPIISVDSLKDISKNAASVVRNQLLHSFDHHQMEELSQGEKELDHVVDDIIREMSLINNNRGDEIILQPQLGSNFPIREENKRISIPSSLRDNSGFKLPQAPIKIKLQNDDPKKRIKDVLNQISEVMKTVEKKRKMQIQIKDAAAQIVEKLPTELKDVGVILIPKNVESVESLDSGNKKIFLFAIPTEYPSTTLENEKEIYINLSNQHQTLSVEDPGAKDSVLNLLVSKLHEEAANSQNKEDNFILDLPIFGISVSEMPERKKNSSLIPLPGKKNVLSIPQFGLDVTVNNETDFLNILPKRDPLGNGSELDESSGKESNSTDNINQDILDLFEDMDDGGEPTTNPSFPQQAIYHDDLPGITGFIEESPKEAISGNSFVSSNEGYFLEQEFTTTTEYSSYPATSSTPFNLEAINDDYPGFFKEETSKSQDNKPIIDYGQSYDLYYDDDEYNSNLDGITNEGKDDEEIFDFSMESIQPSLSSGGDTSKGSQNEGVSTSLLSDSNVKDHEFKIDFEPLKVQQGSQESTLDDHLISIDDDALKEENFEGDDSNEGEDSLLSSVSTLGSNLPLIINSGLASFNVDYEKEKYDESVYGGSEAEEEKNGSSQVSQDNGFSKITLDLNTDDEPTLTSLEVDQFPSNLPIRVVDNDQKHLLPLVISAENEGSSPSFNGGSSFSTLPINSFNDGLTTTSNEPNDDFLHHTLPIIISKEQNEAYPAPAPTLPIISIKEEVPSSDTLVVNSPTLPIDIDVTHENNESSDLELNTSNPTNFESILTTDPLANTQQENLKQPTTDAIYDSNGALLSEPIHQTSSVSSTTEASVSTTTLPYPYSNIVGGVRNVILGILATVMANNLSKYRDATLGFDRINDPDIRKKIEENGIVFDDSNINFTIPVAPNQNFKVDSLKEDLQSAIKSALSPTDELPELKISVEDQSNKGTLSFGPLAHPDSSRIQNWRPLPVANEETFNNAGLRPKFVIDRFKFNENAYSLNDGYPEIASPVPITSLEEEGDKTIIQPVTHKEEGNEKVISEGYDISDYTEWESHKIPSFPELNFDSTTTPSPLLSVAGPWNIKPEIKKPENIKSQESSNTQNKDIRKPSIGGGGWNSQLLKESSQQEEDYKNDLVNLSTDPYSVTNGVSLQEKTKSETVQKGNESNEGTTNKSDGPSSVIESIESSEPSLAIENQNSRSQSIEEVSSSTIIYPNEKDENIVSVAKEEDSIIGSQKSKSPGKESISWTPLVDKEDTWIQKVDESATRKSISEKINVRLTTPKPLLQNTISSYQPEVSTTSSSMITNDIISNEVSEDETSNLINVDDPLTTNAPLSFEPVETVYSDVEYIPDNKIIDYTDDDKIYDQGLNFLSGGSSANIVEASVVEDLNYARSIRNSRSMGIGTIASITIGILVLFGFGLLVFFAVARRRRRYLDDGILYGISTPSQSRTTFTDSPMGTVATPSMSELRPSFTDEIPAPSTTGNEPVLQLDGHQTIISSYNEFLNSGEPLETPPLRTKNLSESSEYLFARQIS